MTALAVKELREIRCKGTRKNGESCNHLIVRASGIVEAKCPKSCSLQGVLQIFPEPLYHNVTV